MFDSGQIASQIASCPDTLFDAEPVVLRPAAAKRRPVPNAVSELLAAARRALEQAEFATTPTRRFSDAHLAALRAGAAVLAASARPAVGRRAGPRSAWVLLAAVAPNLSEWAAHFATTASARNAAAAASADIAGSISARAADDLLRDATTFLELVHEHLGHSSRRLPLAGPPASRSDLI